MRQGSEPGDKSRHREASPSTGACSGTRSLPPPDPGVQVEDVKERNRRG
jgi:hypothetical protein